MKTSDLSGIERFYFDVGGKEGYDDDSLSQDYLWSNNEIEYLIKAIDFNCDGYILKDSDFDTLKNAIMTVYEGQTYIEPTLVPMLNVRLAERDLMKDKSKELTRREVEVLKMIASGSSNKEIASTLSISERTVKNHVSNIFKKIDVSDRTQAAVFAIKNDIIKLK